MNQKLIKGGHTSQKGITLIALVITIIVLLILAGVTINMVLGDDGIIAQAQQSKEKNKISAMEEEIQLIKAELEIEKHANTAQQLTEQEVIDRLVQKGIVEEGTLVVIGPQKIGYADGSKTFSLEGIVKWNNEGLEYLIIDENGVLTGYDEEKFPEDGNIIIPDTVKEIKGMAFENCTKLKSVQMPDTVTTIVEGAFYGSGLTTINIPKSIISWMNPFAGVSSLINVVIEDGVKLIDDYAFNSCTNLTNIEIPDSVETIGEYAFYGAALTKLDIPTTLTSIGDYAFSGTNITSITIPSSVTSIGYAAFLDTPLNYAKLPSDYTIFTEGLFLGCANLENIKIPSNVTSIESEAFAGCTKLTSITIPKSVTFIHPCAFGDELETLNIEKDSPLTEESFTDHKDYYAAMGYTMFEINWNYVISN